MFTLYVVGLKGLAPLGCCPALNILYKPKRLEDAGMTVNDRFIKGGKSRCKVGAAVMLVALVLGAGIASAETHLKAATLQPRLDISSAAPKLSMNDVDLTDYFPHSRRRTLTEG